MCKYRLGLLFKEILTRSIIHLYGANNDRPVVKPSLVNCIEVRTESFEQIFLPHKLYCVIDSHDVNNTRFFNKKVVLYENNKLNSLINEKTENYLIKFHKEKENQAILS